MIPALLIAGLWLVAFATPEAILMAPYPVRIAAMVAFTAILIVTMIWRSK